MDIDSMTIGDAKELARMFGGGSSSHSFRIGTAYLIRTVTHYFVGRLAAVTDTDLVLEDAAWVASTGRYSDALVTGKLDELEPCLGRHIVARGGLIDAAEWGYSLPMDRV